MAKQHAAWMLGKPVFWLVILKWALVCMGVVLIARWLIQSKRILWLAVFSIATLACGWTMIELSRAAKELFIAGRGTEIVALRIIGLVTDLFAIAVVLWLAKRAIAKRTTTPPRQSD